MEDGAPSPPSCQLISGTLGHLALSYEAKMKEDQDKVARETKMLQDPHAVHAFKCGLRFGQPFECKCWDKEMNNALVPGPKEMSVGLM